MSKISLSKGIFWDVDYKALDYKKDEYFIVKRVLNYGDEKDWREIKRIYGISKIKELAKEVDFIDWKTLNFWSLILNIPINYFKCTKKFSNPKQNIFLRR